jgi:TetR/AcrR family transcriptional regulator
VQKRLPAIQRRETILKAACGLFADKGYAGMTTAAIARQARISEPILYRHFPSKKILLSRLLEQVIRGMTETLRSLAEHEPDPVASLRKLCRTYPDLAQRYSQEFRIINRVLVEESADPEVDKLLAAHYDGYKTILAEIIERGQRKNLIRKDIPAPVGAWHLIQSALGFLLTRHLNTDLTRFPDHQVQLAEAALAGLLPGRN